MNLKVAHLVAVQFGMFIGIVSCLVFSRFEYARPRTPMRAPPTERAAIVEPQPEPDDQRADIVDDGADVELAEAVTDQRVPLPNEYSPEAVERNMALATKLYYEQIAPRRPASSGPANNPIAAAAPSYAEVAEEPAVVQSNEPAAETVAYVEPATVIVYPQPAQIVVLSNPRRFVNRCRQTPHPTTVPPNRHRRPDREGTRLASAPAFAAASSGGLRLPRQYPEDQHRRSNGVPSCSSTQGFTSAKR
jgi:hypothetical protein